MKKEKEQQQQNPDAPAEAAAEGDAEDAEAEAAAAEAAPTKHNDGSKRCLLKSNNKNCLFFLIVPHLPHSQ